MIPKNAAGTVLVPAPAEDLCLSFANTRYWRGGDAATETLTDARQLGAWLAANAPMPLAGNAKRPMRADNGQLDALFDEALSLREAIYRIFLAIGERRTPAAGDVATFNQAHQQTPSRLGVAAERGAFRWIVAEPPTPLGGLLAPVIWSAADLMAHAAERRIRRCANDKCRWVFVDRSKGGTRRWCNMNSCGNRAKAHRHYARSKQAD